MSDATFDSTKRGLRTLLDAAREGKAQLPDFQRGWVWDDDHIRDLLASVSRSFPIGAIMMLDAGGDVRFKTRPIEGANPPSREPEQLVLDGQQRLTSLFQSLMAGEAVKTRDSKRNEIERWYYFDMRDALDPDIERVDAIRGVPVDRVLKRNFGRDIEADYSTPEKEYGACVFPVALLFDRVRWRAGFNRFWEYDPQIVELWDRFETEIVERFTQYQLPVIELSRDTPKEAVCLVFEKVNTGGVALTVFELLTATFAADGYDLREDWTERHKRLKTEQPKLLGQVANTDFLQIVSLLASHDRRRTALAVGEDGEKGPQVTCKRRDILRLTLGEYERWADAAERGLLAAAHFLVTEHVYETKFLPYSTQLIPLAACHVLLGVRVEQQAVHNQLARWYWCGVFGELYGSTVETRFARDVLELPAWIEGGPEPRTVTEANFAPERLLTLRTRGSAAYKGIYVLLLKQGAEDFLTGDPSTVQTYFGDAVDIHHVFPKKWCADERIDTRRSESIVNKTPLRYRTNRIIGGVAPSRYLDSLERNHGTDRARLERSLRSHFIEPQALYSNDFDAAFAARSRALLVAISGAIGKDLVSDPEQAAILDEDEDED